VFNRFPRCIRELRFRAPLPDAIAEPVVLGGKAQQQRGGLFTSRPCCAVMCLTAKSRAKKPLARVAPLINLFDLETDVIGLRQRQRVWSCAIFLFARCGRGDVSRRSELLESGMVSAHQRSLLLNEVAPFSGDQTIGPLGEVHHGIEDYLEIWKYLYLGL
jgi:hypothetical protein